MFEVFDYHSHEMNKNLGIGLSSFWTLDSVSLITWTAWLSENNGHFHVLYLDDLGHYFGKIIILNFHFSISFQELCFLSY